MVKLKKSISGFLTSNNSWILVIVLIFLAYNRILTFKADFGFSKIYVHPDKWVLFFKFLLVLIIVFSPAILFSFLRVKIKHNYSKSLYYFLWLLAFCAIPCFWALSPLTRSLVPMRMEPEVIGIFFMPVVMLIDLLTIPTRKYVTSKKINLINRIKSPNSIVFVLFLFLSFYSTFQLIRINEVEGGFLLIWLQCLIDVSVYYLFYLINHHFLVEKIYKSKGFIYYIFSFIGTMMLFFIPLLLLKFYLPAYRSMMRLRLGEVWIGENPPFTFWSISPEAITSLMIYTIPLIILIQWYKQSNQINQLEKEKSATELSLLKQQINPHFFFNTLNNLYSMSLTKDTNTSEGILQLSDLMRYVIYKGPEKTVPISEEIKYLEDYLKLQSLRIHQNFEMNFDKDILNPDLQITPLLFIILVENAFKHGIEGSENPSFLNLSLSQNESTITFMCKNSIEESEVEAPGLGLKNLHRRLQLIYPDRHTLDVKKNNDHYIAQLEIKI